MVARSETKQRHDCMEGGEGDSAHQMTCMEVWGGNQAVDSAVSTPGLDVWVFSKPWAGDDEGGDIHYLSMCAAGNISRFALADVAGHGDQVAGLAGTLRTLMRKNINTVDQSRFTRSLNAAMTDQAQGRFATAILATFFAPSRHLILTNAGHPRPLWFRQGETAAGEAWTLLDESAPGALRGREDRLHDGPANLPLGIIEPTSYSQFAVQLAPGDLVLFYSDAMIEAPAPGGAQLGEAGLARMAGASDRASPQRAIPSLLQRVVETTGGQALADDVTMILLHANGAPPRPIPLAERISAVARLLGFRD
ncbi:MAG: serine/threonine-protein phosphatase [Phycisphaerales bacterium]|nr:serine/threonine-protein phosphatase [Phycisphaerales bacterium]